MYNINLHAHTVFSDGGNTPLALAQRALELEFTALVVTDHYYGDAFTDVSITQDRMHLLRKACKEAREILPVIIGLEVAVGECEVLLFGGEAIRDILSYGKITVELLTNIVNNSHCAVILCHPGDKYGHLLPILDGYEEYNGGQNFFKDRPKLSLATLPSYSNSDAHFVSGLNRGYNIVDTKITNESDLIKYIKSGKQPELYYKER